MSLCVAWKDRGLVYFAADSCAVAGGRVMPYGGIKLLEIPILVRSAADQETQRAEELVSTRYGMAFAGSYFTAFLLKELVAEVLTHVQFLGAAGGVQFEHVCDLVLRFHAYFHEQIGNDLEHDYELDFFLGGYCNVARTVRIARFSVNPATNQPRFEEVLHENGFSYATIGVPSARERFDQLMDLSSLIPRNRCLNVFRRLKDVIQDRDHIFVKGAIQYGEFVDTGFRLAGSSDVVVRDGHLDRKWFVRGTNLGVVQGFEGFNNLNFGCYTFGLLFQEDDQAFEAGLSFLDQREAADGTPRAVRNVIDELITVLPHDPRWQQLFGDKLRTLRGLLGNEVPIEHIGSTAVPGLAAVPIIDVMVGVEPLGDLQHPSVSLDYDLYEYVGDRLIPGQRSYRDRIGHGFNIHVVTYNGEFWRRAVGLRNYLRQRPDECQAYAREKIRILNTGSWTLVRYMNERANYLDQLLGRAGQQ